MELFEIRNLKFAYPDMEDESGKKYLPDVLTDINLSISEGDFVVILGGSGCGKTTLLRQMKSSIAPEGRRLGEILFKGRPADEISGREEAERIGFVMQDVDAQLVTDKVWHELAFSLESLGYDNSYTRRRVAEISSFFGLSDIFHSKVNELSGGQKQLVNLASVMAANPDVLILDEPTSQLDPITANEFISSLVRINRELGTTIIMTEHRLEEILAVCKRAVIMEQGRIIADDKVENLARGIENMKNSVTLMNSMPAAVRIYMGLADNINDEDMPITVNAGRGWLKEYDRTHERIYDIEDVRRRNENPKASDAKKEAAITLKDVFFRYKRHDDDILRGLCLTAYENEVLIINGSNGSGKSTLLSLIAGVINPYSGKINISKGKTVGMLPQDPKTLFTRNMAGQELDGATDSMELKNIVRLCHLEHLLTRHPYDLSGGEQQRLALAKVLIYSPDIILMDEPTKGLDNGFKQELVQIIHNLKQNGKTIIIVSHDIEFCGMAGEKIALLFDGDCVSVSDVRSYFCENSFFTTAAARIAKGILDKAVTVEEIIDVYKGIRPNNSNAQDVRKDNDIMGDEPDIVLKKERKPEKISLPRLFVIIVSCAIIIYGFVKTVSQSALNNLVEDMALTGEGGRYLIIYASFIGAVVTLLIALKPIGKRADEQIYMNRRGRGLTKKSVITICVVLLLIPFTIWFGYEKLQDRKYYFISLMVLVEAMIPFFALFENRKPKVRELVTIAVLCALAVAGRAAFFMLPNFSPVMAVVIISGVSFGAEVGFVVGTVTIMVSNTIIGQGPWTPWQMFSLGLVGFFAGLIFAHKGVRTRMLTKLGLCIFGGLACIVIYGGIMNPASVIMWQRTINRKMLIASYMTGFPFDVVQAFATVIFLWIAARPFLEKLDRVRIKYGFMSG